MKRADDGMGDAVRTSTGTLRATIARMSLSGDYQKYFENLGICYLDLMDSIGECEQTAKTRANSEPGTVLEALDKFDNVLSKIEMHGRAEYYKPRIAEGYLRVKRMMEIGN